MKIELILTTIINFYVFRPLILYFLLNQALNSTKFSKILEFMRLYVIFIVINLIWKHKVMSLNVYI